MPDKNFDELADKGWAAMSTTLGQEMPVQRGRKRLLLWLLLLSMFLGFAGLIYWITLTSPTKTDYVQTEQITDPETQNQMVLTSEKVSIKDENANELYQNAQTSSLAKDLTTLESVVDNAEIRNLYSASNANNQPIIYEVENQDKLNGFEVTANTEVKSDSVIIDKEAVFTEVLAIESPTEGRSTETLNPQTEKSNEQKSVIQYGQLTSLANLGQGSINLLKEENRSFSPPSLIINVTRKLNYLRFYTGVAVPFSSESTGFYGGLVVERELNNRWKLGAGLGILSRFRNPRILSENNVALDVSEPTVEFSDPVGDPNVFNQDTEVFATSADEVREEYFGLVSDKLLRSVYLDIPMEMSYRLALKHEIGLGLRYGYLLSAKNERIYLAELENSLAANAGFLNSNALSNAKVINRHNASLTSSYRYALTRNLGLVANLNLGLNDIIRTNGRSNAGNKLNYIGLGIDYRLKM